MMIVLRMINKPIQKIDRLPYSILDAFVFDGSVLCNSGHDFDSYFDIQKNEWIWSMPSYLRLGIKSIQVQTFSKQRMELNDLRSENRRKITT